MLPPHVDPKRFPYDPTIEIMHIYYPSIHSRIHVHDYQCHTWGLQSNITPELLEYISHLGECQWYIFLTWYKYIWQIKYYLEPANIKKLICNFCRIIFIVFSDGKIPTTHGHTKFSKVIVWPYHEYFYDLLIEYNKKITQLITFFSCIVMVTILWMISLPNIFEPYECQYLFHPCIISMKFHIIVSSHNDHFVLNKLWEKSTHIS